MSKKSKPDKTVTEQDLRDSTIGDDPNAVVQDTTVPLPSEPAAPPEIDHAALNPLPQDPNPGYYYDKPMRFHDPLNFSEALAIMQCPKGKLTRTGWNESDKHLIVEKGTIYCVRDGNKTPWRPKQADIMAADWKLV